jgi:hypothetical protein
MHLSVYQMLRSISIQIVVVLLVFLISGIRNIGNMSESVEDHRKIHGNSSVCFRPMPIPLDGMIKIHGPRQNCCAGSEHLPSLAKVFEDLQNPQRGLLQSPTVAATTIRSGSAVHCNTLGYPSNRS